MEQLYTVKEVSQKLNISLMFVYTLARTGALKPVRVGSRGLRFPESEIQRYLDTSRQGLKGGR